MRAISLVAAGVAGVLLVAVGGTLLWSRSSSSPQVVVRTLDHRPAAGRLTDWPWAPWEPAAGLPTPDPRLSNALHSLSRGEDSVEQRGEAGSALAALLEGKPDSAVRLWSEAVTHRPDDPSLLNDLSVALLARGRPRDAVASLAVAERALRLSPDSPAACFNRTLALESLQLLWEAERSWEACARREPDPQWRDEALTHRRAITKWLVNSPPKAVKEILGEVLPAWGEAFLKGQHAAAKAALDHARDLGSLLSRRGDRSLGDAVAAIDQASGRSLQELASGCRLYGEGWNLYRSDPASSASRFTAAQEALEAGGSPLALWAEFWPGAQEFYASAFDEVLARDADLASRVDGDRSPSLAGQIAWRRGMVHARLGQYAAALKAFSSTVAWFEKSGEPENLGAGYQLMGETLGLIGEEEAAWAFRRQALARLAVSPSSLRRHTLLRDLVESLAAEGEVAAARSFADEAVALAAHSGDPLIRTEALLWHSRIARGEKGRAEARRDLADARLWASKIRNEDQHLRMQADIDVAEAELLEPGEGMMALAKPLAFYRERNLVLNVASTLLARARMAERVQETESALSDLREGIDLFERSWRAFRRQDDGLRRAFLTKASTLYEEALAIESERSCEQALALAERSRALLTGEPGGLDLDWIEASAGQPVRFGSDAGRCALAAPLPDRIVVLELSVARDQLLLWILRRNGTDFVRQPIDRKELARNVELFRQSVRSSVHGLAKTSEVLWNLLLRPVAHSLPDGATLVIVPGPELAHLPFAALRNPVTGRYLVEEHEIQLAPSASFYLRKGQRPETARPGDVLVVQAGFDRESHPELPVLREAQAEASGVAALYPVALVIPEREATRAKVLAELDQHQVVHFLGHGLADPRDPSQSLLLVTPEAGRPGSGTIAAADLMGQPFRNLELVVLAACQSAGTRQPQGAGLFGIARPFLAGGVPAVVGSLLTVPDDATKELMLAFHHHVRAGLPPAAALRQAQLQMLRSARPELREPAGWGGFAVVGGRPLN